jgi:hypothetical protein
MKSPGYSRLGGYSIPVESIHALCAGWKLIHIRDIIPAFQVAGNQPGSRFQPMPDYCTLWLLAKPRTKSRLLKDRYMRQSLRRRLCRFVSTASIFLRTPVRLPLSRSMRTGDPAH